MGKVKEKIAYSEQVSSTYKSINTEEWDSLAGNNFYLKLAYLKSLENSVSEVYEFVYTTYFHNEKPIGISVFQKVQYDLDTLDYNDIPCDFTSHIIKNNFKGKVNLLICGNVFSTGEYIYNFIPEINIETIFESLNSCVKTILKKDKSIKLTIYKDFLQENTDSNILASKYKYSKFNIDVNMFVNTNKGAKNLTEYLQLFKAKYRTRANKVLKNAQDLIVKEFGLEDIENNATEIETLYQSVLKKSNFNIGIFNYQTFYKLKKNLKSQYRFFGYYYDEKLVGFKTFFHYKNTIDASFIGIDYSLNTELNIYQKILLNYIEFALENKSEILNLGRTAETIKACIGAEPKMLDLYIKHRNIIGNTILKKAIKLVKPTEFSARKPFKKEYYS